MRRTVRGWMALRSMAIATCLVSLIAPALASAQTGNASIVGRVTDESGAVLPGVTVTATSPSLQVPSVSTVTDADGDYRLSPSQLAPTR